MERSFIQQHITGFFKKYLGRSDSHTQGFLTNPPAWFSNAFGLSTSAGKTVTVEAAERITTVYAAINVLSETMAMLSCGIKRREGTNIVNQPNHPAQVLVNLKPNPRMSSFNFWYFITRCVKARGDGYALIERDERTFEAIALWPIKPWDVQLQPVGTRGDFIYKVFGEDVMSFNILHFRTNTHDGVRGVSPIMQNAEALGLAIRQSDYAGVIYGKKAPGFLSTDLATVDDKVIEQTQKTWNQSSIDGSTPLLFGGMKYNPVSIPPEDAQYIQSRNLTKTDIYSIYRVPPPMMQDYSSGPGGNVTEQADLNFVKHTVAPLAKCYQKELDLKLFPLNNRDLFTKFNMNSLLMGDIKTREALYRNGRTLGWLTGNEIRVLEGMERSMEKYSDSLFIQGAMIPMDKIDDFIDSRGNTQTKELTEEQKASKEIIETLELNPHE